MRERAIRTALLASMAALLPAGVARADGHREELARVDGLREACRASVEPGPRVLYVVEVGPGDFSLAEYVEDDGFLPIDARRNLRAFGGMAELISARLEPVGFVVTPRRARQLRAAAARAHLRLGFFLGMDRPGGTACLVRPQGVTTVRMDVAFVELVDERGRALAREETDRLRAWQDDEELDAVPGEGPRGALGQASRSDGSGIAPEAWQRALAAANRGPIATALGRCHRAGIARGASPEGQVVVRVTVDARTGTTRATEVELSSIGDAEESECVARALARLAFTPDTASGSSATLSIPVRLVR